MRGVLPLLLLAAAVDFASAQAVTQRCVMRDGRLRPVASDYVLGPADSAFVFERSDSLPPAAELTPRNWLATTLFVSYRGLNYFVYGHSITVTKVPLVTFVPIGAHDGVRLYAQHPVPDTLLKLIWVRLDEPCRLQAFIEASEIRN